MGGGTSLMGGGSTTLNGGGLGDGLPKEPERHVLRGHKSRITRVAMHPVYSDVASSSEDGTVKIWDYE